MNTLETLKKIPAFGRHLYNGQHYSIKYCMNATDALLTKLNELKQRHPELIIYKAKTGRVLFGGTFNVNSTFAQDKQRLLGLK
jgi:hypothetical protein